ncbi:MAG TPA: cupin domain-containing protein [Terriglobia bacterium]|nr:cupin domain-containing protein [Terriglobia bacterium]
MSPTENDHGEYEGQAALYAAGALSASDALAFETHAADCALCAQEFHSLQPVIRTLGSLAAKVPPPTLRQRLLDRVNRGPHSTQVWRQWTADPHPQAFSILRASEGLWEETAIPGISVRRLSIDVDRRCATMLVRMTAGANYPSHRHAAAEECLVLEGDLIVGDDVLHTGDFQRAEARSVHPPQSTRAGCLLYILSSLEDELLEA